MNVTILRKAQRHSNGTRRWAVPGFTNAAELIPSGVRTSVGTGGMFRWPALDPQGAEMQRGVCLQRHRSIAKAEARNLLRVPR